MIDKIKLLELMSARMFHDLAGPVGAVNNSLEFFEEGNAEIRKKALEIMKSSSMEAVLRLKFFRQAYGVLNDKEIAVADIQELIKEFLEKTKLKLTWDDLNIKVINALDAKIILNFVIIALGSMIYGGVLEVSHQDGLKIKFSGNNLIFSESTKDLLLENLTQATLSSSNVQIYYTHMIISSMNYKLIINQNVDNIEFSFK